MSTPLPFAFSLFMLSLLAMSSVAMPAMLAQDDELMTEAEASDYTQTASYDDVLRLMDAITARSDIVHRDVLGKTHEGREIPLAILANPPVKTAADAKASGKIIVFAFANIHAGEVCGKEALLQLMREYALEPNHALFENVILVLAPIYNADGNERFDEVARNRPGQVGPERVGIRRNAQDRDLNRDYIKLEAPETRALVRFLTTWDPHITIDCHTTNGSHHRYTLTYAAPLNPSGATAPIEFIRDQLLPEVTKRVRESSGYDMFFYGNFNRERTVWATYSAQPRFGGPYRGLRGQMSILSEAYSYAPFRDRVICTREFVREIINYAHEHASEIDRLRNEAREATIQAGRNPQPHDTVGIRHRLASFNTPVVIPGFEYEEGEGRRRRAQPTDTPRDYPVVFAGRFEPTLSVSRPHAYIIPSGHDSIIEKLRQHGVTVMPFGGRAKIQVYRIDEVSISSRPFEGHELVDVEGVTATRENRSFREGSMLVSTAQPLGTLIVYLLEPQSEDGLITWGMFGDQIAAGSEFPIVRVAHPDDILRED